MFKEQNPKVTVLVGWVFNFDTEQEIANLVSLIDKNENLRNAFDNTFYRVSLTMDYKCYCVILHSSSLSSEYREVIQDYATRCSGTMVNNQEIKKTLLNYALLRYMGNAGQNIRWDNPVQKPN